MTYYVYSTATCSGTYVEYETGTSARKDIGVPKKRPDGTPIKITINGGHGVANKHFVTPKGVVTIVSDADMDILLQNDSFVRHMKAGFITYDKKHVDPAKKAESMARRDGSAPLTPADFSEGENSTKDTPLYKAKKEAA